MSYRGNRGGSQSRGRGAPRGQSPARSGPRGGFTGGGGGARDSPSERGDSPGGRGSPARGGPAGPEGFRGRVRGGGAFRGGFNPGPAQVFAADRPATVDNSLVVEANQLVASFNRLEIREGMPLRPGFGTLGTPITLRANFYALRMPKNLTVYNYQVEILPKGDARKERKARIFHLIETHAQFSEHMAYIAHDGSERLVSAKELPQPLTLLVTYYEDGEAQPRPGAPVYTVEINFDRKMDTNAINEYTQGHPDRRDYDTLPLISALNLVLQRHATNTGYRVGKNRYFFATSERFPLGLGIEAWKGFFMSVRPAHKQLMVNINVCMTAFYTAGNLADAMLYFLQNTHNGMPTSFVDRLKISTTHLGYKRKMKIFKIARLTARQQKFPCEELGGTVSVEEFFKRKYNVILRHATDLPVIDVGNKSKSVYLPAEVCEIYEGQAYRGKLNDKETAEMIKYACNPPAVNATAIANEGFPNLGLLPNALAQPLPGFGLSVDINMTVVPGRELPPPRVTYGMGNPPNVNQGSWNILNVRFHAGANMSNWAVLLVQERRNCEFGGANDPELTQFLKLFADKCRASGMTVPNTPPRIMETGILPRPDGDPSRVRAIEQIRLTFKNNLQPKNKPSFVLVLLSGIDKYIYPGIKRLGDVVMGLPTVHMLLTKARGDLKKQDQYFSNVALKVNVKLGGTNHLLDPNAMKWLTNQKTMIVGIDVTHPGPSSAKGTPSIAAVVASVDSNFVQYPASLRPQKPKPSRESIEMVQELTAMLVERLLLYEKRNKCLPQWVLIFRDGVSEGQYDTVLKEELPQVLDAFKRLQTEARTSKGPYRPKLTIAICGKRHHARFNATDLAHADRKGNTRPGTVVDRGVTDVYNFDFYLQAHAGLQGTVKPTHYTVVYDEKKLDADTIQQGANTSSYLYARATKAVSLIPPAYYADLACERGRCYLNNLINVGSDDHSSRTGGRKFADEEAEKEEVYKEAMSMWGKGIHNDLSESMFYI